jgi:hypothetical protein
MPTKEQLKVFELSDELLNIIDYQDDFTRSDLQGVVEARVITHCKLS